VVDLPTVHMFEFEFVFEYFVTHPLGRLGFGHVTYKTYKPSEGARYL
jgi:hypothetical protein